MVSKRASGRSVGTERADRTTCDLRSAVRFAVETMEQRVMFAAAPAWGTGSWAVDRRADAARDDGLVAAAPAPVPQRQVFYVQADGAADVDYHGPVTVDDVEI